MNLEIDEEDRHSQLHSIVCIFNIDKKKLEPNTPLNAQLALSGGLASWEIGAISLRYNFCNNIFIHNK